MFCETFTFVKLAVVVVDVFVLILFVLIDPFTMRLPLVSIAIPVLFIS